ncbi:hypothetical protein OPV22_028867 [Ensete ventricosum]|uniref:Uncharacterized protein n=1 Tax=Ensete ventricosum TaxID=4639 RepID=A0AAV8Q423_ENSVE|nr:hypothetical protein OPV22_028867 [Ensete ventricosum]RWW21616.1 hypothetical protein GW17_00014230 [Ensete ventricosum]RWW67957.1 hypothetical protein BHE74_00024556 [Ensete ventricosum]
MPCASTVARTAPSSTQEELVEVPEPRPPASGDAHPKKKTKLGVQKVSRSTAAREATVSEARGSKEGLGGDRSGARSCRGKEHATSTRADPAMGKAPHPRSMKDLC